CWHEGRGRWGRAVADGRRRGCRWERRSHRRVAKTAASFARLLESRGVASGDRGVLWGGSCAEWGAGFVGCVLRGAVIVPLDKVATCDFARRVAEQVDAKLVVSSRDLPEIR